MAAGVRSHRAARGWSQRTLAQRLGWSQATLSAVENGERRIDVSELFLFAKMFEIPVVALFREAPMPIRTALVGPALVDRLGL